MFCIYVRLYLEVNFLELEFIVNSYLFNFKLSKVIKIVLKSICEVNRDLICILRN